MRAAHSIVASRDQPSADATSRPTGISPAGSRSGRLHRFTVLSAAAVASQRPSADTAMRSTAVSCANRDDAKGRMPGASPAVMRHR